MASPSDINGSDYRPPGHQHSLFQEYCADCAVSPLCGEEATETACGDLSEYRNTSLHPASSSFTVEELSLASKSLVWGGIDDHSRAGLVVTSEPMPPLGIYAVDLRTALNRRSPGTRRGPIAFLLGRDDDLERVWGRRGRLGRDLSRKGYRCVVAPAFSTWHDDPPYTGLVSIARTAEVARAMSRQIPTIPSLAWRTDLDIQRLVDWLARSQPIPWVAIDLGARHQPTFGWLLEGVARAADSFAEGIGLCPALVAYGPGTIEHIRSVLDVWPSRVVFASQAPYLLALNGQRIDAELTRHEAPEYHRTELLQLNSIAFEHAIRHAAERKEDRFHRQETIA